MKKHDFCNHGCNHGYDDSHFDNGELLETPLDFFDENVNRRDFLKKASVAGLGAISIPVLGQFNDLFAASSTISVVKGHSESKIVEKAIELVGGISRYVKTGDHVLIKPNIAWDRNYKQAANTNPFVVKKLIELCKDAGASKVVVTDNPCQSASITFIKSGIKRACRQAGAELIEPRRSLFKYKDIGGRVIRKWPVYMPVLEADKLINVPIAKHHSLSRLTLSMKNFYGAVGGSRGRLHQNIHAGIVDLAHFFKPDLTIIDAVRIMYRHGPTGGSYRDVKKKNTVIAGTDFVACDAFATTLFGLKPNQIGYVRLAGRFKLGQSNLSNINVKRAQV